MPNTPRPRRSLLLVSAGNERALAASDTLDADGLIFDLTESVAPGEKPAARERLRDHLRQSRFRGERIVRINGLDTVWGTEDFLAARGAGVDAILLPQVEDASVVSQIATALTETDAPEGLKLWALIGTPKGIVNVAAIAEEAPGRLSALVAGTATLKLAAGIRPDAERTELLPWLASLILAAKSAGLDAIDAPFGDVSDADGLERECTAASRLGFDGKIVVHPTQIATVNERFSPEPHAVAWAERVIEAFQSSPDLESGTASLDGRSIDRLHLGVADHILKLKDAIAARVATNREPR
ncbi:CoA ester lyase [Fulvimarina endophytica]|uniref:CoA ester lyase n=1 Tax=Fulvimarina endophytica TaxID=2293836 RepID=A0A371X137_9HYPH|nr:CoA ester lyase [Fulvimarina endophytica]RFC62907.1 CoA ester lyase [Fulvimarina endophytica]